MTNPASTMTIALAVWIAHSVLASATFMLLLAGEKLQSRLQDAGGAAIWPRCATWGLISLLGMPLLAYLVLGRQCLVLLGQVPGGWVAAVAVVLAVAALAPACHNFRHMRARHACAACSWQATLFAVALLASAAGPVLNETLGH